MKVKLIILVTALFFSFGTYASENIEWLKLNNPEGKFPRSADYIEFPGLCNEKSCFSVVAVLYVTATKKGMRRVAVFTKSGEYLGQYSGFQDMPINLDGIDLIFPKSEYGSTIHFDGVAPPKQVYIDGEIFVFEPKP